MAGKPTEASKNGEKFLAKNPKATAEQVAKVCGLSVSAVQKSGWWKNRAKEPK